MGGRATGKRRPIATDQVTFQGLGEITSLGEEREGKGREGLRKRQGRKEGRGGEMKTYKKGYNRLRL